MDEAIKSLTGIQKGAKDPTAIVDVVVDGAFETMKSVSGQFFLFKTRV